MQKRNNKVDEQVIREAEARRAMEKSDIDKVKELPLDEIFVVLTRQGAGAFMPMIENSISRIVEEAVERKMKEVAVGMFKGLESFYAAPQEEEEQVNTDHIYKQDEADIKKPVLHSRWTKQDDEFLIMTIKEYTDKKLTKNMAFEVVSKRLGRTEKACSYRWHTLKSKQWVEDIMYGKEC